MLLHTTTYDGSIITLSAPIETDSTQIYLAMEAAENKSSAKATDLIKTFGAFFAGMSYTIHPRGLVGEAQGKSSNESWAAKQALRDFPDRADQERIVVTVMDGRHRR